jgi:O-antigen/teichoic acid export membrane protein
MATSLSSPPKKVLRRIRATVFPASIDLSTPAGRSSDRYRRAFLTTIASGLSKIVIISTNLISVPLTLHYLGAEQYGLWMTISSLIACLSFSDLGINNGLLNGISRSHGADSRELARQYVSSAFFLLTAVSAFLGVAFACSYSWIPWQSFFHLHSAEARSEAGPAVAVFLASFLLQIPAGIVTRVQSGYQDGFGANLWLLLGNVLSFAALLSVIFLRGSLVHLIMAISGAPLITLIVNGVVLFGTSKPWLRPQWASVTPAICRELLRTGLLFLALQVAMAVCFSSDNIVIAQVMGAEAVTQYAVPAKLFSTVTILTSLVAASLWPAYGEALVRKDYIWVKTALRKSFLALSGTSIVLSLCLIVAAPAIIRIWVGPNIHVSVLLLVGLGIWNVIFALCAPFSMLLNAASIIRFQVTVASAAAVVNLSLSIYLTRRIGVSGVVYGSLIAQIALVLIPYWFYARRFLGTLEVPASALLHP